MSSSTQPRSSMRLVACGLVLAGVVSVFSISGASAAFQALAQAQRGPVREAQVLSEERTGVASPVGLAFSPASSAFYVIGARPSALPETDVVKLTPFNLSPVSDRSGSSRIAAAVEDPINMAFDARGNRLLLLGHARELLEVRVDGGGELDRQSLNRRDAARFDLKDPQGMAVDPASGTVFILDATQPRIVRVEPASDGSFEAATTSEIDLRPSALNSLRGLAFDPGSGHLHLGSGRSLVELTTDGVIVATRDLSEFALTKSEGLVFAPSGDQTDDPSQLSLYVADSGTAPTSSSGPAPSASPIAAPSAGQIMELSLAPQVSIAAIDFTASLVRTIDTAAFSPPSPDPSGLTYLPQSNTLLMTDGEVEETVNGITHFKGVNVWEMTLNGSVVDTANISKVAPTQVPMTNEPVGVTWKPSNGHYFVSEGITYDTQNDRLFVADGVNAQIYEYTTAGALVGQFDVQQYGVGDPETVEFNPASGTLFVLSNRQSGPIIIETTRSGALLQTVDVSAAPEHRPAGLAYAPASNGSGVKRFYWADREIDNNNDPKIVDGKIFEFTAPGGPANNPPAITSNGGGANASVSVPENQTAVTDVNATDPDGNTLTYSISGGNDAARFAIDPSTGVLTFLSPPDFEAPTDVGANNIYNVIVQASDGSLSDTQAIAVTVTNVAENPPVIGSDGGGATASVSAPENQTAVTDVDATDPNGDTLTYSLSGGADVGLFAISSSTGVLTFLTAPDFEAPSDVGGNNVYDVTVQASDGILSDTQAIAVTVADVNENPVITSDGGGDTASVSVPENQTGATDVDATDPDAGATLTYSVSGGADQAAFAIDPSTGVLTFLVAPDFEAPTDADANNVYEVIVQASDGSLSDTQAIAVTVTNVNEFTPVITSDGGGATAAKSVPENQTAVTDVDATDANPGDTVIYSISGGIDAARFTIVPSSGLLTFASAPNFEAPTDAGANNVYDVIVQASDGSLSDTQAIAVTVTNVAESPVISSNGGGDTASVSAAENQTAATDVDATDGDGDTLTYSISGGADAARFSIVPATGVLTFLTAPDFEAPSDAGANNVYDVIVQASDGTLSDTQAIAVSVTDVTESTTSLYFSLRAGATVGGVATANEDVLFFDGTGFSLAFDGSDVGIATFRIDAFSWVDATRLLLSFDAAGTVPGIAGTVDDSDVVLFTSTSLGAVTAGSFSLYFDGSDVGLTADAHDVDAVELLPSGRILVSIVGTVTVSGVSAADEDLLEFAPTSLGPVTAGTFAMYFDGSDVGLNTNAGEDVDAAAVDAAGKIYLSTADLFAVTGVSGEDDDVFVFTSTSLGPVTAGTFSPTLHFDGSVHGLAANDVFAIDLP